MQYCFAHYIQIARKKNVLDSPGSSALPVLDYKQFCQLVLYVVLIIYNVNVCAVMMMVLGSRSLVKFGLPLFVESKHMGI